MKLSDLLNYFTELGSKDLFQIASDMGGVSESLATLTKLPALVFGVFGVVIAALLGVLGYKLLKPVIALIMGTVGFFAGVSVFLAYMWEKISWMPEWFCFVVAGALAIVFFILALKKPVGGLFSLAAILGFVIVSFYTQDTMLVIAGGVLISLIVGLVSRFFFILFTSFFGSLMATVSLAGMLPNVAILQVKEDNLLSLAVVGGAAVVFIVLQCLINRKSDKLC